MGGWVGGLKEGARRICGWAVVLLLLVYEVVTSTGRCGEECVSKYAFYF